MEKGLQNSEMKLFPSKGILPQHCQLIVIVEERQKIK